jgi:hypothetical protein
MTFYPFKEKTLLDEGRKRFPSYSGALGFNEKTS